MRKILGLAMLLAGSLAACERAATPGPDRAPTAATTLKIVGSSTMAPLISVLAKDFQARHPGIQFHVEAGGSGRGISGARDGTADIGLASRALTDKERDLVGFSIARDGICFIVHSDNPVWSLTSAQVVAIFGGRTANWKALGGRDAPIRVLTRAEGFSSLEVFTQYFRLDASAIKAAATVTDNQQAIRAVAESRDAIAFVSLGEAERQAEAGAPIKLLAFDDTAATSRNIRAGKYPLSRSLTMVTKSVPTGAAKAFIDFALSPQAAQVIRRFDFVAYVD